jgi:hypothetical protein
VATNTALPELLLARIQILTIQHLPVLLIAMLRTTLQHFPPQMLKEVAGG